MNKRKAIAAINRNLRKMGVKKVKKTKALVDVHGGKCLDRDTVSVMEGLAKVAYVGRMANSKGQIIVAMLTAAHRRDDARPSCWILSFSDHATNEWTYIYYSQGFKEFGGMLRTINEQCLKFGIKLPEDAS